MKVSISRIKCFKACRRSYYFKYIENLEPVEKAEPLVTGSNYHKLLEGLYDTGDIPDGESGKELAMAMAYKKYIYPRFKVQSAEDRFEYKVPGSDGDVLFGITDGLSEDGGIVEHKTTSQEVTEQYEYNLLWDEQILAYMLATGRRKVYYTVIRKPTIRQKQKETSEEFFNRMVEWYDEDTEKKIRLLEIERTDEEVENFKQELIAIVEEMKNPSSYYKNCGWCNVWGRRCEYSSICLNYNPNEQYIEFEKVEREA